MQRLAMSKKVQEFMNGAWLGESINLEYRVPLARMLFLVYVAHLEGSTVKRKGLHEFATVPERLSWRIAEYAIKRKWIKSERRQFDNRKAEYIVPTQTLIHMIERELDDFVDMIWKEA
jgi:hypothetical protein